MAKNCMFCNDGQTYSDHMAICPSCGNFLKRQEDTSSRNRRDEFENIFEDISEVSEPVLKPVFQQSSQMSTKTIVESASVTVGRVRNFHEEEVYSPFLMKWFRSFFKGVPFVFGHTLNTFQLYEDDHSETGYDVVFYGKMTRGRFTDFNRVKVYGKPDHSNSIVAKQIINLNSRSAVGVNYLFSAFLVRIITAVLLCLILSSLYAIVAIDWGAMVENTVNTFLEFLLSLVQPIMLLLIVGFTLWFMIRGIFRR